MRIPAEIQEIFLETIIGEKALSEFEEWVYGEKKLVALLSEENYLEIISFGYKTETEEACSVFLEKFVDKGELERSRMLKLLNKALYKGDGLAEVLMTIYDLYCKGYFFLETIGMGYGLRVKVPGINNYQETWQDLLEMEQSILINSFFPGLDEEIKKVIYWLNSDQIILTGTRDELDYFLYVDRRGDY